jgi:hypothetical protein
MGRAHQERAKDNRRNQMALPPLTPEQREHALSRAREVREQRRDLKAALKGGKVTLTEALKADCAPRMKVSALLEALPGMGKVRAKQAMERLGVDEKRRVSGLGPNQRATLLEEFGQVPAGA